MALGTGSCAGRFSLKKAGTVESMSDVTTKYHEEERLRALMRITRGLQLAALVVTAVVGESQTVAANTIKETQAISSMTPSPELVAGLRPW